MTQVDRSHSIGGDERLAGSPRRLEGETVLRTTIARSRPRVMFVGLLLGCAILLADSAAASFTGPNTIQVWTANLRKMNHRESPRLWKKFVRRIDAPKNKPDLIALTEVCNNDIGGAPGNDARQFVRYLEKIIGVNYGWRHSGASGQACLEANSMIVWRARRFNLGRESRVARWKQVSELGDRDKKCSRSDGHNLRHVAVALRDQRQKKMLVASSVHVQVIDARKCINENVVIMERVFERLRRKRRLTIVAGDFNQSPQRETERRGDEATAGLEVDPACWYRSLSMLTVADSDQCTAARATSFGHYTPRIDRYLEAVQVEHHGPAPGSVEPEICDEWTHSKAWAGAGTACTDTSGPQGVPDGLKDRGRIDYIWARWERAGGRARRFNAEQASNLIRDAGADKVTKPPRYADHRAVKARIRWCLPADPCRR